jgi:hypothetical protein
VICFEIEHIKTLYGFICRYVIFRLRIGDQFAVRGNVRGRQFVDLNKFLNNYDASKDLNMITLAVNARQRLKNSNISHANAAMSELRNFGQNDYTKVRIPYKLFSIYMRIETVNLAESHYDNSLRLNPLPPNQSASYITLVIAASIGIFAQGLDF